MATVNFANNAARLDYLLRQYLEQQGGIAGPPNKLSVLSVTTGAPGTDAEVEITGTSPNQQISFTIPRGATGANGTNGTNGTNGAPGAPGAPGADGAPGATGATGPAGADGKDGEPGPPGTGLRPNGYGPLTELYINQVEAAAVSPWMYVVTTDDRANKTIPAGLNGDQARNIISWDNVNGWQSIAPFTGVEGPPGPPGTNGTNGTNGADGRDGVDGAPGAPGAPGTPGINGINGTDGRDGVDGAPGAPGAPGEPGPAYIATYAAITTQSVSFAESAPDMVSRTVTGASTWTFTNPPAAGTVSTRFLEITNGGSAIQTWPASVKWESGTPPTLTAAGTDILAFYTHDGGTTYRGVLIAKDSK